MESIGLLDEKHFLYNEEDDFCRRTRKAGKKICYFPIKIIGVFPQDPMLLFIKSAFEIYSAETKKYLANIP